MILIIKFIKGFSPMKKLLTTVVTSVALMGSLHASEYSDLEAKIDALIEEVESMKSSKTDKKLSSYFGLGNAASRVYNSDEKFSVGGYGHTDYINNQGKDEDTIDNYRAIMYLGYNFSDSVKFQSEIEFEHVDELAVEFAALDFIVSNTLNFRAGNFLIPVGHVNLRHEPTLFLNVSRPNTERQIIPSTWHENGLMVYGKVGNFEYQFATVASLNANNTNDDNSTSVRKMRQSASKSAANDMAMTARLTYKPMAGLELIASGFHGEVDQGNADMEGAAITITEAHILYNKNNINFAALYAQTKLTGADKVAQANVGSVASETSGYYATLGYVIGKWTPFVHVESYDQFVAGFDGTGTAITDDQVTDVTAFGINYRPNQLVVLKADYMTEEKAGQEEDKLSLSVGYIF